MIEGHDLDNRAAMPTRRRRGRPRVCEGPTERVTVRLPVPVYDAICRQALHRGEHLTDAIRRALKRYTSDAGEFRR